MTREPVSRALCSYGILLVLGFAPASAQTTPDLSGKWALNRALSQFPSELGFDANFRSMAVDEQEAAERGGRGRRPPSRIPLPESADEGARKQQLTDEVRDPAPNLTITDTPDAVTFADDRGHSRTFHPNGKEELIQLGGVGVVTIARREAGQLLVLYEVAAGTSDPLHVLAAGRPGSPHRGDLVHRSRERRHGDAALRAAPRRRRLPPRARRRHPRARLHRRQERRRPRPRYPARAPSSGGSRRSASSSKS